MSRVGWGFFRSKLQAWTKMLGTLSENVPFYLGYWLGGPNLSFGLQPIYVCIICMYVCIMQNVNI